MHLVILSIVCVSGWLVVDSQPTMEETILVGDDLMMGPPSPLIPPEIASHVLEGVDICDGILRNLFLCKYSSLNFTWFCQGLVCASNSRWIFIFIFRALLMLVIVTVWYYFIGLQINDIEPFCQDEIALYRQCAERRVR